MYAYDFVPTSILRSRLSPFSGARDHIQDADETILRALSCFFLVEIRALRARLLILALARGQEQTCLALARQALLHADEKHKFVMDLGESEVIDASQKGSILRFVNHSCGPNAETQKWMIQGKRRIGLFATEVIEKGVEVRC